MELARTSKVVLSAVALAAGLTSVAKAYTTYSSWGTLNVPFYVNPANLDVSASAATSAIQAGMNAWNTQSGTGFRFNYAGQVSTTSTGYDNKNIVVFRNEANSPSMPLGRTLTPVRSKDSLSWRGEAEHHVGVAAFTA